jgi:hypothetical protein
MSSRALLALAVVAACLPDNPNETDDTSAGTTATTDVEPTGGPAGGLFGCDAPPCTLVLVSQTLDDRVDVYDADARTLRGRIDLDLKDDPSGKQIDSNLLDEPYELALTDTDLLVTLGHWPDTDEGSILRFPRQAFADLAPGATFSVADYFNAGSFTASVQPLTHARREGIFLLPHPSGRMIVGVFANDLRAPADWTNPSELLVFDPADLDPANLGSFDLGTLDVPCTGGWRLEPLDAAVSKLAVACDGSDSVAVLELPADFATASPADAAAGITGCGYGLYPMRTSQFVAPDGAGGLLSVQSSQLAEPPRFVHLRADCTPLGVSGAPPAEFSNVLLLRQPVLVRPASEGDPLWLLAAGPPSGDVVVVRGGAEPALCGRLGGLDLLAADNAPWALALTAAGDHLALGAGPPSNPELAAGRGQVLWGALDRADLDACAPALTDVVDLTAGLFVDSDPSTWVRAPNVVVIAELGGAG